MTITLTVEITDDMLEAMAAELNGERPTEQGAAEWCKGILDNGLHELVWDWLAEDET